MSLTKLEGSSGKVECLSVVVHKDEKGYGMTVSGNDPVLVQSVVKNGAAWRAGVRIADKLLRVNGTSVETAVHQDVVDMIKSSNMVELYLQRACTTKITAPIPVDREIQRQVENTRRQTLQRMLESQNNHIDCLRSELARGGSERCINELEAAETNRTHLQQQLEKLGHPMIITSQNRMKTSNIDPPTPSRHSILSNIPRSLSNLTGQSIRGNRSSQPPVTCLDGTPPPLPPRTPVALSPNNHSPKGPSPGGQVPKPPPMNMFNRHMEPNSIGVQMNYPLAVTHPPIQSGGMGHQRSRSSPEQLSQINNSIDKEWDTVITPPGTPPPPYPSSPIPQAPIESQRAILSMEEDDGPWPIIHHSTYYNRSFSNVDSLSPARMAIFLNWIIGERRPPQAALLYLLTAVYSSSTSEFLPHWPYELHSAFLVPGAPLLLHNVDENMAKTIDDILIKNTDKDNLKNIFLKVREKAKEELNEQLNEFQIKRQSGLGAFYGPADSVLEQCDNDRHKELSVITEWLLPQLNLWLNESGADHWEATYGSSTVSLLAAAVHPLLRYFGFKTQMINEFLRSPTQGSPPRPEFLQMNRHYKQRVRLLKKSSTHPLIIRGHRLSPLAVVSVSHCQQCHLLIWGIAPQAYICSDCKLLVHRCCAKEVEENCCGPAPLASRKSRLMDRLAPPALTSNLGNSHQHIDSNQHFYHHHHHDKKQRKSLGTSNFLNMERNLRRNEEEMPGMDMNSSHHSGDSKRDADDNNLDGSTHHSDTSHQFSEHSFDIADNSKRAVRQRPVKTESFRDKAANVQRTKRNTSDPKLLASENALNDAESSGILGGQYGGSSKSSLSSSNEQIDDSDVHLEAFEEEENAEPWSTKALPDILASMSLKARKRQDLIHELIASEVSHVRWLRILRHVFYNPLHQHSMLTDDELNNLFPNLPAVLQKHRKLCTDLKTLAADSPIVQTKPLAEALIATLGEPKYPKALAKFCKGQRLALDSLRDKRKRTKELNAFLTKCEQDPLCARLHLQELLACVWQRLTKYQLLLDGIIKTVKDENSSDAQIPDDDGLAKLEQALNIAKDVLHTVNTAVKTTENKKRLKDIQKKMEIRGSMTGSMTGTGSSNVSGSANLGGGVGVSGNSSTAGSTESDHGDLRKLDLNQHSLVMEGTLSIRIDVAKQTTVLALFLSECLVLLQRETDRYILRPIPRAGLSHPLSPIVRWDTVFFRSDASTKFGFLLLGINGRHMYELAATNHSEYNMWIKHITEFANAVGPRSGTVEEGPPPPLPSNPPPSTIPSADIVSNGTSDENTTNEGETPQPPKDEDDGKTISGAVQSVEGEVSENRRPSGVSMIAEDLITPASVAIVTPPIALTAERLITPEERLRQAEEKIAIALQEAAEAAKETASAKPSIYSAMGTLLGSTNRQTIVDQSDQESKNKEVTVSTMELLLTAQSHVNTLTEVLLKALRVTPVECSMTVCSLHVNSGLCDTCAAQHSKFSSSTKNVNYDSEKAADDEKITFETCNGTEDSKNTTEVCIATSSEHPEEKIDSILQLEEVGESSTDPCNDPTIDLVTSSSLGLREILATLIQRLPAEEKEREFLRARLQQSDQRLHRLHHLHKDCVITESSSDATNTVQEVPNSSSTDQSGGEG